MNIVRLQDHGILPETDITLALYDLFRKYPKDTEFVFEDADYYLNPHEEMHADYRLSNSDVMPYRVLGLWLKDMENCTLTGNGARLYFAGQMQPVTMDHCRRITMRNFVIDWKKPLVAEGTVVGYGEGYADLYIDPVLFPHRFENGWIEFDTGAGEWYPLNRQSQIQFDGNNRCVTRASGDNFTPKEMADLGGSVYRVWSYQPAKTNTGNVFVLRHNARIHAGMFNEKCEDITYEDITVYSCGGLGCLAQFNHNLTYRRVHFVPNTKIGRKVANGRDDGMHITSGSGTVTITECTFLGLMDDPINVHSCCVTSDEVVNDRTLRCKYRHPQACGFHYWAETGDTIAFIERKHMSQVGEAKAVSYTLEDKDTFTLVFDAPLPDHILALAKAGEALALDNLTHTAAFICTKNRFGSCRARGILVSTPKPVRIAENYFSSSGSAILVAGDSNYWFESGECHDVEITDNVFTDVCLSSMYQFCDGMISICPVVPEPDVNLPFHKHIRITGNTFDSPDTPVLYAYSCADLTFIGNRIFHSPCAPKWHPGDWRIKLDHVKGAVLTENLWVGDFGGLSHCIKADSCENIIAD